MVRIGQFNFAVIFLLLSTMVLVPGSSAATVASTWSAPSNVSASSGDSWLPALAAADDGALHLAWDERGQVYHSEWLNGAWSLPVIVDSGHSAALTAGVGGVHLVYVRNAGKNEVFYRRWDGVTWSDARNVSSTSDLSLQPAIAVDQDGHLYVLWTEGAGANSLIFSADSIDGETWSSGPIPFANGSRPAVAVDAEGNPHVVWQDRFLPDEALEILYSRWTGSEWTLPTSASDDPDADSFAAKIAIAAGGQVHVVWQQWQGDRYRIVWSRSDNGGWTAAATVSLANESAFRPALRADADGGLHLGWDTGARVHYRLLPVGAHSWDAIELVTENVGGAWEVAVTADTDGRVHAAWSQPGPEGDDVFHSQQLLPGEVPQQFLYLPLMVHSSN